MERNKTFSGLLIIPNIITKKWGLYLQTPGGGGHGPTGPSASSPPKVKMISEYKRILWQATSSLIIDLSSFLYSGISDRNSVCYQMPSCNVYYLLDLTKTKDNLFFQILAASDLLLRFGTRNHLLETLPEDVQMAKFSPNQFLLQ